MEALACRAGDSLDGDLPDCGGLLSLGLPDFMAAADTAMLVHEAGTGNQCKRSQGGSNSRP